MWWGAWRDPQTTDGFKTALTIKGFGVETSADILYIIPHYQPWYATGGNYDTQGCFSRRENGRVSFLFPFQPF